MSSKRVLITGATGFIGSAVARHCVSAGHDVLALVRPTSDRWRLADLGSRLRFVEGDLLAESLPIEPRTIDLCIHLAWDVPPGAYLHSPRNLDYQVATLRLARILAAAACPRLVAVGTCFEYDPEAGLLGENSPTEPRSFYATCKLNTFYALQSRCGKDGLELAWARLFYQYGPTEDPRRLVPYVIRSLLQGRRAELTRGEQVRDFLHVADVAAAVCAIAESDALGAVNIGSGRGVTVADIAMQAAAIMNRPELIALGARPDPDDEPMRIVADNARLRSVAGWTPRFDLNSGLRDTIDWWDTRLRTHG